MSDRIRVETDGLWPVALVQHEGRWVTLNSRRNPINEASQTLKELSHDAPLVVIIGLGLGYALDALEHRGWPGRVLGIEVDPALSSLRSARRSWASWNGRLTVVDSDQLDVDLWRQFGTSITKPLVLVHPVLARTHHDIVRRAQAALERAWFDHSANEDARRQNAGRYVRNTLRNLSVIRGSHDVDQLNDACRSMPVVVIGAGPSLDENLDALAAYRDRAVLVAVDTALRPLLEANVEPDFVVAVDPTEANARHLADLPPCRRTWLVTEGSVDPAALTQFSGRTFVFRVGDHHPWPWLQSRGLNRGTLRAWGSVLTTAFDLAVRMGADPLIFAAADLAFTAGRPYARNTTNEESWLSAAAWGISVEQTWQESIATWEGVDEPDVRGGVTRTAAHLRAFRDWIVRQTDRDGARRFINGTGAGILVGGSIRQTVLRDVLSSLPHLPAIRVPTHVRDAAQSALLVGAAAPISDWISAGCGLTEAECWLALGASPLAGTGPARRPSTVEGSPENRAPFDVSTRAVLDALPFGDRQLLRELFIANARSCRLVAFGESDNELIAQLRREADALGDTGTLVLVDVHGHASGARLRSAAEQFLCERPSASLEYRCFEVQGSRLALLRLHGGLQTDVESVDALKNSPEDRAAANRLMPIVATHLQLRSVIDLGCGPGHWIDSARRAGIPYVVGVATPDIDSGTRTLERRFDACLCLEVAHRVALDRQDAILDAAVRMSDVVVFSSAPPGLPGESPHARPLSYWAAKFWDRGYVLDDSLRQRIEQAYGQPMHRTDMMVVFKRATDLLPQGGPGVVLRDVVLAHAERIHNLYIQALLLRLEVHGFEQRLASYETPQATGRPLRLPAHRLVAAEDNRRTFRFRTEEARWWLTHPGAAVRLFEDDAPLTRHATRAEVIASLGGFAVWRDEIVFASTDGSDPRSNGRIYSALVPPHVAAAEARPLAEIIRASR